LIDKISQSTNNTVLSVTTFKEMPHHVRKLFQKESLKVDKLERLQIGPYRLSLVPTRNQMLEVEVCDAMRKAIDLYQMQRLIDCHSQMRSRATKLLALSAN
jgi:16S rRNA U516 pseudouridylate synthase RsuA-like enzyme